MISTIKKPIPIITGGLGFCKTALIEELRSRGYLYCNEFTRDLYRQQVQINGDLLLWKDARGFLQEILRLRKAFFDSVPEGVTAFARYRGFNPPADLTAHASLYRCSSTVWVTPP